MNPGIEQNAPVVSGGSTMYPDLVLYGQEKGRRLQVVVEVETGESVNHLEALSQWAPFARLRAAFHLYVPASMVDVARRLCEDNQIQVNEIWSFHMVGDEVRFTLVQRSREAAPQARSAANVRRKPPAPIRKRATRSAKPASRPKAKKAAKKPGRAQKRR
jgi:hypothetical protein